LLVAAIRNSWMIPDHMRIGHVDDGEFRLVASSVGLDSPDPEDAIDKPFARYLQSGHA
jgi:hypothetical protein